MNIHVTNPVIYFIVTLVVIPILTSREQVGTCNRVIQITGRRLILDMLLVVAGTYIHMYFLPQVKANLSH